MPEFNAPLDWIESGFKAMNYNDDVMITDYMLVASVFPGLCSLNEWSEWDIDKHDKIMKYTEAARPKNAS